MVMLDSQGGHFKITSRCEAFLIFMTNKETYNQTLHF